MEERFEPRVGEHEQSGMDRGEFLRRAGGGVAAASLLGSLGGKAVAGAFGGDASLPTHPQDLLGLKATKPKKAFQLGLNIPQFRDPYWVSVAYGASDEARRWGARVVRCQEAGSYLNLHQQISQMENLAELGVDAILFGPVDYVATAAVVKEVTKKGIPVINVGNLTRSNAVAVAVTYDMYGYGIRSANVIGKALHGKGTVVMLSGPAGASWSTARAQGFRDTMKKKFPNIKIEAEQTSNVDRLEGQRIMEDWLQRFGKVDAVFTVVNLLAEGAVLALREQGQAGKATIVTSASTPDTIKMLQNGEISWVSSEPGALTGRWGVQYAFQVLNGQKVHIPPKPSHAPAVPKNLIYLPTPVYTTRTVTASLPYKYDWAPKGWSPSQC